MPRETLVIAEAGVNHDGSADTALQLIDVAADVGADIVKFQTFDAAALATPQALQADYQRERAAASSQIEMLRALQLDDDVYDRLVERCHARGIEFLSTAFDEPSLARLVELGIQRVKVPSGELTNGPLLLAFARTGLPLIVSTGMANLADVETALSVIAFGLEHPEGTPTSATLRDAYRRAARSGSLRAHVSLLHCTSSYPAPAADVHLAAMETLEQAFALPVGYSDHTLGTAISIAAVARGAHIVEKHLTLDRSRPGPDHAASLEPDGFRTLVAGIREVEAAIGTATKYPTADEEATIEAARRSVVAAHAIERGELFDHDNLTTMRPAGRRAPNDLWSLLGRPASRAYDRYEPISDAE